MNLYKFNFDLAGSSNAVQTITIPTDSKYSMGLKFFKGNEELILGDDVKITIQDDKYIYTPTEIFNNYAVFAGTTGSTSEGKTYRVNFHMDGKPTKQVSYSETPAPKNGSFSTGLTLQSIIESAGPNFEDFDYAQYRFYYEKKVDGKDYSDYENANKCDDGGATGITSLALHSENFPTYITSAGGQFMTYGSGDKQIYMWRINGKYGFIPKSVMVAKEGQPVSENDFLTGSISDWFDGNIPTNSRAIAKHTFVKDELIVSTRLYGKPVPEFNANFKGVNIKTNDSKISNWAVTDSQMKIVYTDEWETMKDTADDRVIYFVVDRPTPPQPIPPKPVPPTPGETRFGIRFSAPSESDEFDPNSVEDCLSKSPEPFIKYTRDGVNYYIDLMCDSSPSAEVQGDAVKIDQISTPFEFNVEDDGKNYLEINASSFENNKIYMKVFGKEVSSQEEAEELKAQYYFDRFGEEGTLPNTTNPIPSDIDDWKIVYEEENEIQYTITDEYVYIPGTDPIKMLLNSETFPQWLSGEPR